MQTTMRKMCLETFILLVWCSTALGCHGTILASGITAEEKRIILKEHNALRQMVATGQYPGQPEASNMREIVWDDELAARAQKWADNCQFRHDPYRTINRFTMGQNMAIIWSTIPLEADDGDFPSRIKNWFNEVHKYSFGDAWSPKTGHYSQLVWAETYLIGCGYSEYKDNFKYNKLYVCNYGPGGNVVGFDPYEIGAPSCEEHGMQQSRRYYGLCSSVHFPSTGTLANSIEQYDFKESNIKKSTFSIAQSFINKQALVQSSSSRTSTDAPKTGSIKTPSAKTTERLSEFQQHPSFKNTILKPLRNQSPPESSTTTVQPTQTPRPAPRSGWSLLTWRG